MALNVSENRHERESGRATGREHRKAGSIRARNKLN
jgi:hypothetical protein